MEIIIVRFILSQSQISGDFKIMFLLAKTGSKKYSKICFLENSC